MTIKYVFDINTQQPVYAVCDIQGNCLMLTTSICTAINKIQNNK